MDEENLLALCEKTRSMIEKSSITKDDSTLKVTISIGATIFRTDDSIGTALNRADELLYQSKSNGRNRVTLG